MRRAGRAIVAGLLAAGLTTVPTAAPADAGGPPPAELPPPAGPGDGFDALAVTAAQDGEVRVVVRLEVAWAPEGAQPDPAQRSAIRAERTRLLEELAGSDHAVVRTYDSIPHVALTAGPDAVERLRTSDHVAVAVADTWAAPTLADTTRVVGADHTQTFGHDGTGWSVAVLDTGVQAHHPFFGGRVVAEACFTTDATGPGYASSAACPNGLDEQTGPGSGVPCAFSPDECDHGTHVAGIAAGARSADGMPAGGVAPEADVVAVQVFSEFTGVGACGGPGPCALSWTSDQLAALEHVHDNRATWNVAAVNMSLGGGGPYTTACDATNALTAAIDNLASAGIATVVASGNDGFTDGVQSPACVSDAVAVGSTGTNSTHDAISEFSNSGDLVDVLAPGDHVFSSTAGSSYEHKTGTSMATPHVAGAWAALREAHPTASFATLRTALVDTGVPIADTRPEGTHTKPRIDLLEASRSLAGGICPLDDGHEDDDFDGINSWFRPGAVRRGTICPGDPDHVAVQLFAGAQLTVDLAFTHADGDLDLALLDGLGNVIASSATTTDDEQIVHTAVDPALVVEVRVTGKPGVANAYVLTVTQTDICPGDDAMEENDHNGQPFAVPGPINAYSCAGDQDWYAIGQASAGDEIAADLWFDGGDADLALFLVGPDFQTIDSDANAAIDGLHAWGRTTLSGTHYVLVSSDPTGSTPYRVEFSGTTDLPDPMSYVHEVSEDLPLAWWRLGDSAGTTAADATGNGIDATYSGGVALGSPSLVVGDSGGAAGFDGVDDVVVVPDHASLNTGGPYAARTVELWFETSDVTTRRVLYEQGGGSRGINVFLEAGRVWFHAWNLVADDPSTPWGPIAVSAPVTADTTHHAVLVLDAFAGALTGHVDGQVVGSETGVGKLFAHGDDAAIGGVVQQTRFPDLTYAATATPFAGTIDEVALYPTALSIDRIAAHHAAGSPGAPPPPPPPPAGYDDDVLADGPLAYWRLGDASGTVAADASGNGLDATLIGGPTLGAAGLIDDPDTAVGFDAPGQRIEVPNDASVNTGGPYETRSIELWFQADDVTTRQILYEEGGGSRGLNLYLDRGSVHVNGWNLVADDPTAPWGPAHVAAPVASGTPHHVVLVLDHGAGTIEGFLDGASMGTDGGVGRLFAHGDPTGIGAAAGNTRFHDLGHAQTGSLFAGTIDEVALFAQALTASDVADRFVIGSPGGPPPPPPPESYADTVAEDTPVAWWRLGDGGGTTAADASGNGRAATYVGGVAPGVAGLLAGDADTAAGFDGTDDRVLVADHPSINTGGPYTARSVELWFSAAETGGRQVLYEQGGGARGVNVYLDGGLVHFNAWNLVADDPSGPWGPVTAAAPVTAGTAHHVVLVLDEPSDTLIGYLDGQVVAIVAGVGRLFAHGDDAAIGGVSQETRFHDLAYAASSQPFAGTIDEVALYGQALTADRVAAHHHAGSPPP